MVFDAILLDNAAVVDVPLVNRAGSLADLVVGSLLRHDESFG